MPDIPGHCLIVPTETVRIIAWERGRLAPLDCGQDARAPRRSMGNMISGNRLTYAMRLVPMNFGFGKSRRPVAGYASVVWRSAYRTFGSFGGAIVLWRLHYGLSALHASKVQGNLATYRTPRVSRLRGVFYVQRRTGKCIDSPSLLTVFLTVGAPLPYPHTVKPPDSAPGAACAATVIFPEIPSCL